MRYNSIQFLVLYLPGPVNNLMKILRENFEKEMDGFYSRNNFKQSEGIGGTFAGK